jgi:SAM-dependent methyltransferase
MEPSQLGLIAHRDHPIAAPLSDQSVDQIVEMLTPPAAGRALDLGCGSGAWLLRTLDAHPGLLGVGVDLSGPALAQAERETVLRGLSGRVQWVESDGATWGDGLFDVVICVGASHVFGGLDGTLSAVRTHVRAGGQVVLGEAIWEGAPTRAALERLEAGPEDVPDLPGLVDRAREHNFEVGHGHVSTLQEWDDYEWSWTGSLVRWALGQTAGDERRTQALTAAREHRDAWLRGYRRQLGFATLVLLDDENGA